VILALIDVESAGDPEAHRKGSQFYGLLQMGKMAGLDVGIQSTAVLSGEDGDPESEDDIEAFLRLCERYSDRHGYHPYRIAALWKGGAGTAKTIGALLAEGETFEFALAAAELRHKIPNLREYVLRFRKAFIRWRAEELPPSPEPVPEPPKPKPRRRGRSCSK
jgi:hypothetical protein